MITFIQTKKSTLTHKIFSCVMAFTFMSSMIAPSIAQAQMAPATVLGLPAPGTMVAPTDAYMPAMITGMSLYADNPLQFDFIVDPGESGLAGEAFKEESVRLIKYFLASMTVPDDDMWVNLSPYEKDRITSQSLGETELGRDLLAQDYMLKQLSASLAYPEEELGKEFWARVRAKAREQFGVTEIPVNTFNKVWIVPEYAKLYEHNGKVFVLENRLKVMLEEDYAALNKNLETEKFGMKGLKEDQATDVSGVSSQLVREILIPEIEREVNEGQLFANLRQIYNSMLLATWYKRNLKESLLGQVYADQAKTRGVDVQDKQIKEKIYAQYIQAFKRGVYNYIKKDVDPVTGNAIPRKYFSGGATGYGQAIKDGTVEVVKGDPRTLPGQDKAMLVENTEGAQIVTARGLDIGPKGDVMAARKSAADRKVADQAMLAVRQISDIAKLNPESVMVAVDWNVKRDGDTIKDDTRIRESIATFTQLLNETSAKFLYVMTHSGRPKGDGFEQEFSLAPITQRAQELVGETVKDVRFVTLPYDLAQAKQMVQDEKAGAEENEKIVFAFENIRFYEQERSSNPDVREVFERTLVEMTGAEFYVNEAMSKNHRGSQASMEMIKLFDAEHRAAGVDVAEKVSKFVEVESADQRPLVVVAGGAKFDKYKQLAGTAERLTAEDTLVIVGALAYPWLASEGVEVGASLLPSKEKEITAVEKGIAKIKQLRDEIGFEVVVTADHSGTMVTKRLVPRVDLTFGDKVELSSSDAALDIGQKTLSEIEAVVSALNGKGTIILNGGAGVFEKKSSRKGTMEILKIASQAAEKGTKVLAIGGDMNAAITMLSEEENLELSDDILRISGGGVLFEILNKGLSSLSPIAAVLQADEAKESDQAMLAQVEAQVEDILAEDAPTMLAQLKEVIDATPEQIPGLAAEGNKYAVLAFEHGKANRMGFLPEKLARILDSLEGQEAIEQLLTDAQEIRENFDTVVFAGMGGSGLSVEKASTIFSTKDSPKIISVRTTDPTALKDVMNKVMEEAGDNVREALKKLKIVVISKSGGTAETIGHLKYLVNIYEALGMDPAEHIVLYTDPDSEMDWQKHVGKDFSGFETRKQLQALLEKIQPQVRFIQLDEGTDVGGRNTAPTTNVFLLPTAILMGEKVFDILKKARDMNNVSAQENVFLKLGAYLYLMAKEHGKDKVTFVLPPETRDVFMWSEQLFEESLDKLGKGVTIVYEDYLTEDMLKSVEENDRVFLRINLGGKETQKGFVDTIKEKGYPVFDIDLDSKLDIGGLQLGLQMAVVTMGYLWNIVTIDQDPVEHYKKKTRAIMVEVEKTGKRVEVPEEWRAGAALYGDLIDLYYQPVLDAGQNRLDFLAKVAESDENIPIPSQWEEMIKYGIITRAQYIEEYKTTVLPVLEKGIITREKLEAKVAALGADINNAAAVKAALDLIAEEEGALKLSDTYSFGRMSPEFKAVLTEARKIYGRQFKIPTKLGEGPDFLHAYFVNIADGPDVRITTVVLPNKVSQPDFYKKDKELMAKIKSGDLKEEMFFFDENLLRAPAIGMVQGLIELGRKAVLMTLKEGIDQLGKDGLTEIERFYQEVEMYIAAGKAEKELTVDQAVAEFSNTFLKVSDTVPFKSAEAREEREHDMNLAGIYLREYLQGDKSFDQFIATLKKNQIDLQMSSGVLQQRLVELKGRTKVVVKKAAIERMEQELKTEIISQGIDADIGKVAPKLMAFSKRYNYLNIDSKEKEVIAAFDRVLVEKSKFARDLALKWVTQVDKKDPAYQSFVNGMLEEALSDIDSFGETVIKSGKMSRRSIEDAIAMTRRLLPEWLDSDNNTPDFIVAGIVRGIMEGRSEDILFCFGKNWRMFGTAGIRNPAVQSSFGAIADLELSEFAGQEEGIVGHHAPILTGPNLMNVMTIMQQQRAIVNVYRNIQAAITDGTINQMIEDQNLDPRFVRDVQNNKVSIAYDSRLNGKFYAHMLAAGFLRDGVQVDLFDRPAGVPPVVYQGSEDPENRSAIGILISASHSPAHFNGFKAFMMCQRAQVDKAGKNLIVGERPVIVGNPEKADDIVVPYQMQSDLGGRDFADFDDIFADSKGENARLKWFGKTEFNPENERAGAAFDNEFYDRYYAHVEELSPVNALGLALDVTDEKNVQDLSTEEVRTILDKQRKIQEARESMKIFYTAFSGCGAVNAQDFPGFLNRMGYTNVLLNEQQTLEHNGSFAAFNKPRGLFGMPDPGVVRGLIVNYLQLLQQESGKDLPIDKLAKTIEMMNSLTIGLATDPDIDRAGVEIPLPEGINGGNIKAPLIEAVKEELVARGADQGHIERVVKLMEERMDDHLLLTANDAWTFIVFHKLRLLHEAGKLDANKQYVIEKSHVTTDALTFVAEYFRDQYGYNIHVVDTYVGFTELAKKSRDLFGVSRVASFISKHLEQLNSDDSFALEQREGTLTYLLDELKKQNAELKKNVMFQRQGIPTIDAVIADLENHLSKGEGDLPGIIKQLNGLAQMEIPMGVEESNGYGEFGIFVPNADFVPESSDRSWSNDAVGSLQKEHISEKDGSLAAYEFAELLALGSALDDKTPFEMYLDVFQAIGAVGTDNRYSEYVGLTGDEKKLDIIGWQEGDFGVRLKKAIDMGQEVTLFNGKYKVLKVETYRDAKYDDFWIGFPEEGVRLVLEKVSDGSKLFTTYRGSGTGPSIRDYNWIFGALEYSGKKLTDMSYEELNEYRVDIVSSLNEMAMEFFGEQDRTAGYMELDKANFVGFLSALGEVNKDRFEEVLAKALDEVEKTKFSVLEQKMKDQAHSFALALRKFVDTKKTQQIDKVDDQLAALRAENTVAWEKLMATDEVKGYPADQMVTVAANGQQVAAIPAAYAMGWQTSAIDYMVSAVQSQGVEGAVEITSSDPEIEEVLKRRYKQVLDGSADKAMLSENAQELLKILQSGQLGELAREELILNTSFAHKEDDFMRQLSLNGARDELIEAGLMKLVEVIDREQREMYFAFRLTEKGREDRSAFSNSKEVGGIDLNPALLDMQIKRDGNGIPLPASQQPIESFQIQGLIPVIINVTPAPSLPMLLGSEIEEETEEVALLSAK